MYRRTHQYEKPGLLRHTFSTRIDSLDVPGEKHQNDAVDDQHNKAMANRQTLVRSGWREESAPLESISCNIYLESGSIISLQGKSLSSKDVFCRANCFGCLSTKKKQLILLEVRPLNRNKSFEKFLLFSKIDSRHPLTLCLILCQQCDTIRHRYVRVKAVHHSDAERIRLRQVEAVVEGVPEV